jgi:TatD DNase family protein
MQGIIDIHTHSLDSEIGSALISIGIKSGFMEKGKYYSVGLHPWNISNNEDDNIDMMSQLLSYSNVLAVGECGLDSVRGPSMDMQETVFIKQLKLSESFEKPVIIHQVKAIDRVILLKKEMRPKQRWLIHGFRGGPIQATQLLALNIDISFGKNFNIETLKQIPLNRLFVESDEYCNVFDIYSSISNVLSIKVEELYNIVAFNTDGFLKTSLFAL